MKASDDQWRLWDEIGRKLAHKHRPILVAAIRLLDAMLITIEAREDSPGAPLNVQRMFRAARGHGVAPWGLGRSMVLLASIPGLDLANPWVRQQLFELQKNGEIRLVRIAGCEADSVRRSLRFRGERCELLEESEITDGRTTYHALDGLTL